MKPVNYIAISTAILALSASLSSYHSAAEAMSLPAVATYLAIVGTLLAGLFGPDVREKGTANKITNGELMDRRKKRRK